MTHDGDVIYGSVEDTIRNLAASICADSPAEWKEKHLANAEFLLHQFYLQLAKLMDWKIGEVKR